MTRLWSSASEKLYGKRQRKWGLLGSPATTDFVFWILNNSNMIDDLFWKCWGKITCTATASFHLFSEDNKDILEMLTSNLVNANLSS